MKVAQVEQQRELTFEEVSGRHQNSVKTICDVERAGEPMGDGLRDLELLLNFPWNCWTAEEVDCHTVDGHVGVDAHQNRR